MNYELKPCPFCGGIPLEGHTGKLNYTIKCHECGLTMEHDRIDKIRGEWNKRNGKYPIEQDQPSGEAENICSCSAESERWTPVEERLPERGETLLFCTDLGYVTQGFLAYGPDVFVESFTSSEYSNVTNWRPLPKPPTE